MRCASLMITMMMVMVVMMMVVVVMVIVMVIKGEVMQIPADPRVVQLPRLCKQPEEVQDSGWCSLFRGNDFCF